MGIKGEEKLINKCLSIFNSLPIGTFVSFSELVKEAAGMEEAIQIEKEHKMFMLLKTFFKEAKKLKIHIKWRNAHGENVGLPYNAGFCKIDLSKEIKTITLNYSYSCWGMKDSLKRQYVVFSSDSIKYVTKPLNKPTKRNPLIEITFDPFEDYSDLYLGDNGFEYLKDYDELCALTHSLVNVEGMACDAVCASVVITYQDGHRKKFNNQCIGENECFDSLCEIADKYKPDL